MLLMKATTRHIPHNTQANTPSIKKTIATGDFLEKQARATKMAAGDALFGVLALSVAEMIMFE